MSRSWPEKREPPKPQLATSPSREEWETYLKRDCVLVTIELGDRVVRRAISKTLLKTATYPMMLLSEVLHDPLHEVLGK